MRLKKLAMQGFKSFADRTVMELPNGVAAVVGPNGSGKSNICDALRWVMGEQSIRLLRGERLEDVIFAGSEGHKAVGMAEVSLTFDNSEGLIPVEYSEVTVTRRVFRSGESQFFMNKNACRLRDIQELFMDTGLGRGGLSIIGQGEIGSILSAKPEERRAFIDEAAGIAKYRLRKREALTRLAQTREDLTRVSDIILEVEGRIGPLKRQSENAVRWKTLSDQLIQVESGLLGFEYRNALEAENEADDRLSTIAKQVEETTKRMRAAEKVTNELVETIELIDAELESARTAEEVARRNHLAAGHNMEMAKERLLQNERNFKAVRERIELGQERRDAIEQETLAIKGNIEQIQKEIDVLKERLADLDLKRTEADALQQADGAGMDELTNELVHLTSVIASTESRLETLQNSKVELEQTLKQLLERRQHLLEQHTDMTHDQSSHREEVQLLSKRRDEIQNKLPSLQSDIQTLQSDRKQIESKLSGVRSELHEAVARHKALSDMEASGEGYHHSVRRVLQEAERVGWGLKGAVAQLISVPDHLERAIEVALGGAAQYVVAASNEDAKAAIDFLKRQSIGRVTFLPLDLLSVRLLSPQLIHEVQSVSGVIGIASNLVEIEDANRRAIDYLLGRVIITQSIDSALIVSRQAQGISRAVSLEGDVVVPGGAMTGGSSRGRGGNGLLSRRRQITQLSDRMALLRSQVVKVEKTLADTDVVIDAKEKELAAVLQDERDTAGLLVQAEKSLSEITFSLARIEDQLKRTDEDITSANKQRDENERLLKEMQVTLAESRAKKEVVSTRILELESHRAEKMESTEALRQQAENVRIEMAEKLQSIAELERSLERLERERIETEQSAGTEAKTLQAVSDEKAGLEKAIEEAEKAAVLAKEEEERAGEAKEALLEKRGRIQSERRQSEDQTKAIRDELASVTKTESDARVALERCKVKVEQIRARFAEQGLEPVLPPETEVVSDDELKQMRTEVRRLKREIDKIGPVNLHSIEEYDEVSERYKFLTAQREDLEEAIEKLEKVVKRIDEQSEAKLIDVFDRLRSAFKRTFVRMFGGGRADLAFTDPERPLESGIDMLVQPPGKKMQNLMALSGGEKALAAVAILFALLDVSPIPFCLLDEVDAALDEQNLERFRTVLLEYAKDTQFVVITHRQATMEGTERLFGVTMENAGVSKVVSIQLDEVSEYASTEAG